MILHIHTIIFNNNDKDNINNIIKNNINAKNNVIIWTMNEIKNLIIEKHDKYFKYFDSLILNKSKENFSKYIILYENGGIFINYHLLMSLIDVTNTTNNIDFLNKYIEKYFNTNTNTTKDIIIFKEQEQKKIYLDFFNINCLLNDDLIIVKNKYNKFIKYILSKTNLSENIIIENEYQNRINLGNVFLSIGYNDYFGDTNYLTNLIFKNSSEPDKFIFSEKYKSNTYPNVPNLQNPANILDRFEVFHNIKKSIENICVMYFIQTRNIIGIVIALLLLVIINWFFNEMIETHVDIKIKKNTHTTYDNIIANSKIFFNPRKYKFLRELKNNWKDIRDEALWIMNNAPQLNISRNIENWYNSNDYIKTIYNKYGWINSWNNYSNNNINENTWLNYGLIYNVLDVNIEFTENIRYCPKTIVMLRKISNHINICGFSLMRGGCVIQLHKDETGIRNGSLAMHLGLEIPQPTNTSKLIFVENNNNYVGINEDNGKMIIFDATNEHYAYNQSDKNRIILYIDFKI